MKLEIETQEELEAARAAVEKLREGSIRHVGKWVGRLQCPGHSTIREKAFADLWREENLGNRCTGNGFLDQLLCYELDQKHQEYGEQRVRSLTPAEATAAATVIQWLGTNVGWCFLEQPVKKAGYRIVQEPRKEPAR